MSQRRTSGRWRGQPTGLGVAASLPRWDGEKPWFVVCREFAASRILKGSRAQQVKLLDMLGIRDPGLGVLVIT